MVKNKAALKTSFILLLVLISLSGIFSRDLWKPDEPRVAEIGREMWVNHQYVIPTLDKRPFLEKPPLYWWAMSISYELFGVSDASARLPSALFAFLTLFFTYLIGRRIGGEETGMFAALVLATLSKFSVISHRCLVDNALIFFVTLGYYGFFIAYDSETPRGKWVGYNLMAVASGLAFLSKGLVGPGLIIAPPLLVLLIYRDFKEFKRIAPQIGVGILLFIAIVAPWIVGLYFTGGGNALREYLLQNTLGRMLPSAIRQYVGGHQHDFLFYFRKLPESFVPWVVALPAAILFLVHPPEAVEKKTRKGLITAMLLFAGAFLLLSLPATKRSLYLVPIYPLCAIVIGGWLSHVCRRQGPATTLERWTLLMLLGALSIIPLGIAIGSIFIVLTGIGPQGIQMAPVIQRLTPMLVLIVPLGILAFLFLANKFLKAMKNKTVPSCVVIFTTVILLFLAYHEGAVRIMNSVKSIRAFPDKARPHIRRDIPLAGYNLDELTRGMIPFYTGHYINEFYKPSSLIHFLQTHPEALLIIPEREVGKLPSNLREKLELIAGHDYTRRFKLRLYRVRSAPKETRPSTPTSPIPTTKPSQPGQGI